VAADLRDTLQTTLGSGYTVERELGGGGMSRVFVARDRTLDRSIVVKVLPAEAAADVPIERFKREIALAARLQHPHIVPLLSAGDLRGLPYYTMPYVDGESLRARLLRGEKLSISECVSILKDLARALAYAHEHGVVHRDIKPENILLTGGSAVVTDFGIAKAIVSARTAEGGEPGAERTLTQVGASMGTPAYMSPEQISGDPSTNHRTDIYAFGCVGYELLAGAPPFSGPPHRLFSAHLGDTPRPILEMRPDCSPSLAELVMRCLEKDPERRPQSAAELLQSLDFASTPTARTLEWSPPKSRRSLAVIATLVGAAVVVAGYLVLRARPDVAVEKRLAVIPFANVGGDSAQQYFADGVSDELTTALGRVPGVQVSSRNLAYRYRGQRDVDARSVGRALDVGYVVQGSVRRAGGRLRISAQLTSAKDGAEVWADVIERDAGDVFRAQDDITKAIIGAVQPRLASRAKAATSVNTAQGTSNVEAYDLYLRGRFLLERRGRGVELSIDNFNEAIAKDSSFGRAYAGLALALELMPYFSGVPAPDVRAAAWEAAQHALAIDSTLADAHAALGMLYEHEYQWKPALEQLRRALEYNPADASVRLQLGRTLLYTGDLYAAKAQFEQGRKDDPYSALMSSWLSSAFALAGQTDSAVAELHRAFELDSTNLVALGAGSQMLVDAGRIDEARALLRRMPDIPMLLRYKGYVAARTGNRAEALRILRKFEAEHPRSWLGEYTIALTAVGLGDTARALGALERATDAREIWPTFVPLMQPLYDPLRGSPRFAALIRRVGLDEKIFTAPNGGRPR
jgi:TolB-like protein/tetratricopeptide (TPR) repeat protein